MKVVNLTWSTHGRDLTAGLWKFFVNKYKADFDVSINGNYIKGHQIILGVFSPVVQNNKNNKLILGENLNIEQKDIECLIEFLYRGKIDVNEERLPAMKLAAKMMGIKVLADIISKFIQESTSKDRKRNQAKLRQKKQHFTQLVKMNEPASKNVLAANTQLMKKSEETVNKIVDVKLKEDHLKNEYTLKLRNKVHSSTRLGISKDSFDPGSLEYKCKHCDQGFSRAVDFYNHIKIHENRNLKFKCQLCEYKTEYSTSLVHHTMSRHGIGKDGKPLEKNLKCPHCPYVCAADFRLKNHIYQAHVGKTKACDVCDYRCSSYAVLNKHKTLVHSDVRPYMCESCGYRAKSFQVFRNHMRTHFGKKVTCDICGNKVSFTQLSLHKRIHLGGPKPHACHLCSFTALRKCSLKIHLKNVHKYNEMEQAVQNVDADNLAIQFMVDKEGHNVQLMTDCVQDQLHHMG